MARGTFGDRTSLLEQRVGRGDLSGKVEVDQPYAKYQHETPGLNHPRGGSWKYLERALTENYQRYLDNLADNALDGDLVGAMRNNMENLSNELAHTAPVDEPPNPIKLRFSGSPRVYDNGALVYIRPPHDPRERE